MAWTTLMKWYNSKHPQFPLGIHMMFIPSKDHPDIRNNPAAAQNISTLLDRQRIFLRDTDMVQCPHLAFPDADVPNGRTLRHELMDLTALTMGEEHLGAKLFHAINKKVDPKGNEVYQFTFHKSVARESLSVISGMGQFITKELKLDADFYCHPHLLKDEHDWDTKKRCVINPTTDYISNLTLLAGPGDDSSEYKDEYSLDTKGKRESRRITGQEDEETIKDLTTKKKAKHKRIVPADVKDDGSVQSEISELTKFSSSTKASRERKNLRHQIDEKDDMIAQLRAELARSKLTKSSPPGSSSSSENNSGECTSEPPKDGAEKPSKIENDDVFEDGWHFDDGLEVTDETTPGTEKNFKCDKEDDSKDYGDKVKVTQVNPPAKKKSKCQNGLLRVFRGSPQQIRDVAAYYKEQGAITIQTLPFKDGTITKVDLYKVVDMEKFKASQNSQSQSVKFSASTIVQEYDSSVGVLSEGRKSIRSNNDPTQPDDDEESSGSADSASGDESRSSGSSARSVSDSDSAVSDSSSGSSTTESLGKQAPPPPEEGSKRKRPTSVTQATLAQAKVIVEEATVEESAGDGPTTDV